jgi:hypothetical protein
MCQNVQAYMYMYTTMHKHTYAWAQVKQHATKGIAHQVGAGRCKCQAHTCMCARRLLYIALFVYVIHNIHTESAPAPAPLLYDNMHRLTRTRARTPSAMMP